LPASISSSFPFVLPYHDFNCFEGECSRHVVGIGHSLGGATTAIAACIRPEAFKQLILVDPTIPPPSVKRNLLPITVGALLRRPLWPSRRDAYAAMMKKTEFFGRWDPAVVALYLEFAMVPTKEESSAIELKTRKLDEAVGVILRI
jgi:pimeloyl-ACP methyl ester carboxylesterase